MGLLSRIFGPPAPPDPSEVHIGDLVEVASGGPLMTVARFDDTGGGAACCQWFDGRGYHEAWFYPRALKKVKAA
jgi:uncharacterized protein YodC (DUF2158 family)